MKIQYIKKFCIGCRKYKTLVSKKHYCIECTHQNQIINTLRNNTKNETQSILTLTGIKIPSRDVNKMNVKEMAKAYEPPTTKNITDLEKISVEVEITTETFTKKDSEETFDVDTFEVDGSKYRMPKSVIAQLKEQISANPDLKFFRVSKTGNGLDTKYVVIPILG